jgi:hypothetical protein
VACAHRGRRGDVIGPDTVLQRRSDVRYRHFPPETIVIRQAGPEVLVLNGVAGRILDLVDGKTSVGELAAGLVLEYDAPRERVERDVLAFVAELVAAEVFSIVPRETGGG